MQLQMRSAVLVPLVDRFYALQPITNGQMHHHSIVPVPLFPHLHTAVVLLFCAVGRHQSAARAAVSVSSRNSQWPICCAHFARRIARCFALVLRFQLFDSLTICRKPQLIAIRTYFVSVVNSYESDKMRAKVGDPTKSFQFTLRFAVGQEANATSQAQAPCEQEVRRLEDNCCDRK